MGGACPQHGKSDEMATPGIGCRVSPSSFPDPPPVPATAGARSTSPGPWGTPGRAVGGSWGGGVRGTTPPPGLGGTQADRFWAVACRCTGIGTTGIWSSGRATFGGRPRRRFTVSILPLMKSCPPHTPNNSRRSSAASRHSANTEQSAHALGCGDIADVLAEEEIRSVRHGTARRDVLPGEVRDAGGGVNGGVDEGLHDLVSSLDVDGVRWVVVGWSAERGRKQKDRQVAGGLGAFPLLWVAGISQGCSGRPLVGIRLRHENERTEPGAAIRAHISARASVGHGGQMMLEAHEVLHDDVSWEACATGPSGGFHDRERIRDRQPN